MNCSNYCVINYVIYATRVGTVALATPSRRRAAWERESACAYGERGSEGAREGAREGEGGRGRAGGGPGAD